MDDALEGRAERLTPPGVGGICVFAIEGSGIDGFLKRHFQGVRREPSGRGRLRFGHLRDGDDVIDEVVIRHHDESRTGGRMDLSIHGGPAVEARVTALLQAFGFDVVKDRLAPFGGSENELDREARASLQSAFAVHPTLFLLSVLDGKLEREVTWLINALAPQDSTPGPRPVAAESRLVTLLDRAEFGLALVDPPLVVVAGDVNVGKSTLFNRLIGTERAIVSPAAGTTRDAVEVRLEIDGYPFRLTDTAGLRESNDPVEKLGVGRSERLLEACDVVLRVIDVTRPDAFELEPMSDHEVRVFNKVDLVDERHRAGLLRDYPQGLWLSAKTGEGIETLRRRLVFNSPFRGPAAREFPCPFTVRQVQCLEEAVSSLPLDPARAARALERLRGNAAKDDD